MKFSHFVYLGRHSFRFKSALISHSCCSYYEPRVCDGLIHDRALLLFIDKHPSLFIARRVVYWHLVK